MVVVLLVLVVAIAKAVVVVVVVVQGWTFAKITKSTCACRLTENEHKKRQKVLKEKDETGENREY